MPESDRRPALECRPTAWVLAAPGAGDNGQLRALVELLDADARWVDQVDPVSRVLRDRLAGFPALGIPGPKKALYAPPWPDLVLIAGGRAVIDARRIRHASGGRSRVVCLGRPWAPLQWFDLVVTTPQYRLPEVENVLTLDLPLNLPPRAPDDVLTHWRDELKCRPGPLLGVLLGGDSGSYRFDSGTAGELARSVNRLCAESGGSAVLIGSPRTPQKVLENLKEGLERPARIHEWQPQAPNPYAAVVQLADALLVTGDSASMLAEACHTGKPVGVFDLRERARSRLNRKLRDKAPMLGGATARLAAAGLWIPARDRSELHRRVAASGCLTGVDELPSGSTRTGGFDASVDRVRERVFEILKHQLP